MSDSKAKQTCTTVFEGRYMTHNIGSPLNINEVSEYKRVCSKAVVSQCSKK